MQLVGFLKRTKVQAASGVTSSPPFLERETTLASGSQFQQQRSSQRNTLSAREAAAAARSEPCPPRGALDVHETEWLAAMADCQQCRYPGRVCLRCSSLAGPAAAFSLSARAVPTFVRFRRLPIISRRWGRVAISLQRLSVSTGRSVCVTVSVGLWTTTSNSLRRVREVAGDTDAAPLTDELEQVALSVIDDTPPVLSWGSVVVDVKSDARRLVTKSRCCCSHCRRLFIHSRRL